MQQYSDWRKVQTLKIKFQCSNISNSTNYTSFLELPKFLDYYIYLILVEV